MPVDVYYHDFMEVDPVAQWTGLCPSLAGATYIDIASLGTGFNGAVEDLFDYARPDIVVTVNGAPVVSIEQTAMNPSGHNIPQRFTFQVRAAELGVPSILYYPRAAARTFSDPNVRYLNVRVPLAQARLTEIYGTAALSVFWPVDNVRHLPIRDQAAHQQLADLVEVFITNGAVQTTRLPEVQRALADMEACFAPLAGNYRKNPSVRLHLPGGFPSSEWAPGHAIDPPNTAQLVPTDEFLRDLDRAPASPAWAAVSRSLAGRRYTLVFTGTANALRTDSEHPWPGYLSLLDILYARRGGGRTTREREVNLVYRLPVDADAFVARMNAVQPSTASFIVDTFADLLLLRGGGVPGRPQRGDGAAYVAFTL